MLSTIGKFLTKKQDSAMPPIGAAGDKILKITYFFQIFNEISFFGTIFAHFFIETGEGGS